MKLERPEIVGDQHLDCLDMMQNIILTQREKKITNGIKGFLLHGPPGTGKSSLARRLIYDIATELGNLEMSDEKVYTIINAADIARPEYGKTETVIRNAIQNGIKYADSGQIFHIIVMEDVDGIFPSRESERLDAWFLGHLNVLFNELDRMKTNQNAVILTTNKMEFMDDAIVSRLYPIEVPGISLDVAKEFIEIRCKELHMFRQVDETFEMLEEGIDSKQINAETLSFRDVNNVIMKYYVELVVEGDL